MKHALMMIVIIGNIVYFSHDFKPHSWTDRFMGLFMFVGVGWLLWGAISLVHMFWVGK
jgi:hypothetical protein